MCEMWILILLLAGWIISGLTFVCYYYECRRNKASEAFYEKRNKDLKKLILSRDRTIELFEDKIIALSEENEKLKKRKKKKKK